MAHGSYGSTLVKITILIEGKTERAFLPFLRAFLQNRLEGRMPRLDPFPCDGRIPTGEKLRRTVARLLNGGTPSDYVIALTDVYTGTNEFADAAEAKRKMLEWVKDDRFFPHAAQYDFEAWLLPYWDDIKRLAGSNRTHPAGSPENVNHNKPPSYHIKELFESGRAAYVKARDASRILKGKDLLVSARQCPELRAFLNRLLALSGGEPI